MAIELIAPRGFGRLATPLGAIVRTTLALENLKPGEITIVLGPGAAVHDAAAALGAVGELVGAGVPRKQAAELVARLTGVAKNELYRGSL